MVVLRLARASHREVAQTLGVGRVPHIEQRHLGSQPLPRFGGVLADAHDEAIADRMQVRRIPGDLQLSADPGCTDVTKVHHIQRVGLAERHHVPEVAHEPDGVDLLAPSQPPHLAHHRQHPAVGGGQLHDLHARFRGAAEPCISTCGGHAQRTLVFAHGELVQERSV